MTSPEGTQFDLFDLEVLRVRQPAYVRFWYHHYLKVLGDDRHSALVQQEAYVGIEDLTDPREDGRGVRLARRSRSGADGP